ncbi:hypothetical protein EB796_024750 [Bugula neritina]|uniref:Tubulin-specific chaperone E n=1 Tax=Bugula neritina TaxID=10212 RepID=A0A7J7IU69_BUGNE|nr:hypothetical protein EB796_024750 [Bugula neritina]
MISLNFTKMSKTLFNVGDRVGVNDYIGTVRYKGPVENAKGEYYGVEWDQINRGKHNGTHLGKSYFTTRNNETSATFIKAKIIHPASTCLEAIKDKYGQVDDELAGVEYSEAFIGNQQSGKDVSIELVGMKKVNDLQSQFSTLRVVAVQNSLVYGEEDSQALGQFIPSVEELDLSGNLMSSWSTVANIIKHLNKLTMLYLSDNRLVYVEDDEELIKPAFQNIRSLILNAMSMTWDEVLLCSPLWMDIRELHLCRNSITEIPSAPNWQNLVLLNLSSNNLKTWTNVKPFAKLPMLQELLLVECQLTDIIVDGGDFPSLQSLYLNDNKISEWVHIGQLHKLSTLTDIVFMRNPVLERAPDDTNRQLVIAKIPSIIKHNGTRIEALERKGAEIDYTKMFGEMWIEQGSCLEITEAIQQFCLEHPTYLSLIKKWGAPEKTEVVKSKPKSAIKDSLIEVTFVDLVTESGKRVTKCIPDTMNVVKCRNLAIRLLGIKGVRCVVSYRAHQNGEEYEFEYDLRTVTYYGVQNGDEILLRQLS